MTNIAEALHVTTHPQLTPAPGARAYKGSVAPILKVITVQKYEESGFLLFQTLFSNKSLW